MIDRLRRRITMSEREGGFTLIELLVVIVIIGVLLAIAVPSYLGFKARAQQKAAEANVRSAIPAVEAFYSDNNTYAGIDLATLRASYDAGLPATLTFANLGAATYCVQDTQGTKVARKNGPAAQIEQLAC